MIDKLQQNKKDMYFLVKWINFGFYFIEICLKEMKQLL